MRIACVHVPQFALQALTRIDPSLRGAAVAVVGQGGGGGGGLALVGARRAPATPVVLACSRAAWALGIRLGMTATAANAFAPGQLRIVTADPALERETVRAIADALLSTSPIVDVGGRVGGSAHGAVGAHLAMYCEVPSKTRGASFGERLISVLAALGVTARIGIADDRFTAWVAASAAPHAAATTPGPASEGEDGGVVSVPRGGSAAFLAPRPLSLLAISLEVQHMLEALGVRTLGEFAALPAPSVSRPLEADYQALARGEGGQGLRPYTPEAPVREDMWMQPAPAAAIATLARRLALRLAGRGRGAARLEVTIHDGGHGADAGNERVVPLAPIAAATEGAPGARARVLESAEDLADAIGHAIGDELGAARRVRVAILGEAIGGDAGDVLLAEDGTEATADVPPAAAVDALSVVLASTGSGAWRLTGPSSPEAVRNERRDAHRRTRRGKQHRRVRGAEAPIQAWLFAEPK